MKGRYCGECGSENEEDSKFCYKCGAKLNVEPDEAIKIETNNEPYKDKKRKSPIAIIIVALVAIGGAVCGIICLISMFSVSTPPKELQETVKPKTVKPESTENKDIKEKSDTELDTDGVDGIEELKYTMQEIEGEWNVSFKKFVSIDGNSMGLYESQCKVVFEKVNNEEFNANFEVESASINGEPVEVGNETFSGTLVDNYIKIPINCEKDYLNVGKDYIVSFLSSVENGKMYGKSETTSEEDVDGCKMTYKIVMEFTQK